MFFVVCVCVLLVVACVACCVLFVGCLRLLYRCCVLRVIHCFLVFGLFGVCCVSLCVVSCCRRVGVVVVYV